MQVTQTCVHNTCGVKLLLSLSHLHLLVFKQHLCLPLGHEINHRPTLQLVTMFDLR